MTEKDAATLAHEAETARARLSDTAEKLRDKMSPGQILDECMDYFRNSDGAIALDNLKTQARDNPLPLALIGAGLGWFLLGGGPRSQRIADAASDMRDRYRSAGRSGDVEGWYSEENERYFGPHGPASQFDEAEAERGGEGYGSSISDTARSAGSAAARAASGIGDSVSAAGQGAADAAYRIRDSASRAGSRMQHRFTEMLERDPLIIGAVGIALGAAVGAMLPRTRTEDEYLGPYRDQARDAAEKQLERGMEEVKQAASTAYNSMTEEMKKEGLTSDTGPTVSEKVASATKSAAKKTESKVRSDMGQTSGKTGSTSAPKA